MDKRPINEVVDQKDVSMFAYSSRMDKPVCTKLDMHIPLDQKDILERLKPPKKLS
jgi:hypothetical protein